jgi:hypothetical protein
MSERDMSKTQAGMQTIGAADNTQRLAQTSKMSACGKDIQVQGRVIRIGSLDGDKFKFLDEPEEILASVRVMRPRVDIFTFMQKLPETHPKYR